MAGRGGAGSAPPRRGRPDGERAAGAPPSRGTGAAAAPPPAPAAPPSGARRKAPTDKMVAFARSLADRKGVELPNTVLQDFDSCRQFLDQHAR
ncbi:hypothetical protein GAY33_36430 [Azospirillum brasilense]|nr:hypothetical protein [Azospirillum argentinense]